MNLKELSSPIRMYWDLGVSGPDPDYVRIADEIAANKFLTVQVTLPEKGLNDACLIVLNRLRDKPLAQSLVLPVSAWNKDTPAFLKDFPIRLLLISASSHGELKSILPIQKQGPGTFALGTAFSVTRENFRLLPQVLKFCIDHQIRSLVLPMQRLTGNEEVFCFSKEEREELASELNGIERPDWLKITIHDPFLWRAFFPSVEFPDGGCQAANTMLYISPDARVYPCPTLPIMIGDLRQTTLEDVIRSGAKKRARQFILSSPPGCRACPELNQCKGGCRGRAYSLKSPDERDPACT